MTSRWRWRLAAGASCVVVACAVLVAQQQNASATDGRGKAAFLILDLRSGQVVAQARPDVIASPMAPGSVIKIATLIAAFEQHVIDGRTAVMCRRTLTVEGHTLTCVHPDLHRPLNPAEALAYSCNTFFATIAQRIPKSALDGVLVRLGLPPLAPQATVVSGGLGLDGIRVAPRALLDAFVRVAGPSSSLRVEATARGVLNDGLRKAAEVGTASAFSAAGLTALAKTGTAPMPGGGYHGIVVAVTPADRPTHAVVAVVPGGAGADAAAVASAELQRVMKDGGRNGPRKDATTVRVGVARRDGRGYDVVSVPLETYVSRVVAGEMKPGMAPAALEALAIAVRTYAVANQGRHAGEGFDLCDLTHCQVMGRATADSNRAAAATDGLALMDGRQVATVYFSSSCGGHTETPSRAWKGAADKPYLPAMPDTACGGDPEWSSQIAEPDLRRVLQAAGMRGTSVRGLSVIERTASGRVAALHVDGYVPDRLAAEAFYRASGSVLGWQVIKSTLFNVRSSATGFEFKGHGLGHGVGLCVRGASNRAAGGTSRAGILGVYFPGLSIRRIDAAAAIPSAIDLRILMPESDRGHLGEVRDTATIALRAMALALAVDPPAQVELRFHPTVEAFARATGMPWWAAARTSGTRIDLQPREALQARGVLELTLRHETVHVLTDPLLQGRPLWVREGLARVMAREAAGVAGRPVSGCPTDSELRSSASADAWRLAYERAGQCVADALASGRRWQDLR